MTSNLIGDTMEMTDVQLKADVAADGWVRIWAVDDKGRHLHTEPVCVVPMNYHQWFIDWICGPDMEPPIQMPALLED